VKAHLPRHVPDPARAHGAWVYLGVSVLAGALTEAGQGVAPALLVGLGYAGVFLLGSSVALRPGRWRGRFALGLVLALAGPGAALLLGADPAFLAYAALAVFPAGMAAWCAVRRGFQSPLALAFGVTALTVAAPAAACAGGASRRLGWILLALLVPFFVWRTWRLRVRLTTRKGWTRAGLRAEGLREAALALAWTAIALAVVHLLPWLEGGAG
jgi:hypothetical protein